MDFSVLLNNNKADYMQKQIGKYKILNSIGEGTNGTVYTANDYKGNSFALKMLHPHLADIPAYKNRFINEAKLAQRIAHPHVIKVIEFGQENGCVYVVMEFLQSKTLLQLLEKENNKDIKDKLPRKEYINIVIKILEQITGVLQAIYDIDYIHCDIKPRNILLDEKNNIKILDFGLAQNIEKQDKFEIVSPSYMAPEVYKNEKLDIRSDLYSLGISAYQLLSGQCPFNGPSKEDFGKQHNSHSYAPLNEISDTPINLSYTIDRLLSKSPANRHQTPSELIEDLNRIKRGELPVIVPHKKKSKILILIVIILISIITTFTFWFSQEKEISRTELELDNYIEQTIAEVNILNSNQKYEQAIEKLNATIKYCSGTSHSNNEELKNLRKKITENVTKFNETRNNEISQLRIMKVEEEIKNKEEENKAKDLLQKQKFANNLEKAELNMLNDDNLEKSQVFLNLASSSISCDSDRLAINKLKEKLKIKLKERKAQLAIIPFTIDKSVIGSISGEAIAVNLESKLSEQYRLIDRMQTKKIMQELKFQTSDFVGGNISSFGKFAAAKFILTGSVTQLGKVITINGKIIDVKTGEIIKTANQEISDISDIHNTLKLLAKDFLAKKKEKKTKSFFFF